MKRTFLGLDHPLLTVMVQANHPDRIKDLIDKSIPEGADAFGMQLCQLKEEFRTKENYRMLFAYPQEKPVYVTNYRNGVNKDKADDILAEEMLEFADCGTILCDIMGDYFDRQP